MDYALSVKDIIKLCPEANVVTYDKLIECENIDQILYPHGKVVILYMLTESFGHYCCLWSRDGELNFFNSYGEMVDDPKVYTNVETNLMIKMHETSPILLKLMVNSRYKKLNFNQYKFQGKDSSTCGRFCVVRLWLWKFDDDEFKKFIISTECTPDQLVVLLTENVRKGYPINIEKYFS